MTLKLKIIVKRLFQQLDKEQKFFNRKYAVCRCEHITICSTCSSREDQDRFDYVSEIGR